LGVVGAVLLVLWATVPAMATDGPPANPTLSVSEPLALLVSGLAFTLAAFLVRRKK
jgi:hypothetical protein